MAREVKFQLGSTLRGLGTSKLGDACTDYQASALYCGWCWL